MKEKIYGMIAGLALFSLLAMSLGLGGVSAAETSTGNGFEWEADGSSCDVEKVGSDFQLDVNFAPGDDGGAYAAGGMGFEWGGYDDRIVEEYKLTKDKTDDHDGWIKSVEYDIEKNEHKYFEKKVIGDIFIRDDTFDYRIEQTTISYVLQETYVSIEDDTYQTSYTKDMHEGPGPMSVRDE